MKITDRRRWKGHKGKFWNHFAYYVCLRDAILYGVCITCGKPKEFRELQAGHFVSAGNGGFGLLFDEENVNGECAGCNGFNPTHLLDYKVNLIKRIGEDRVAALEERYRDSHYRGKVQKEWSKKEYLAKIEEYKQKIIAFENGHRPLPKDLPLPVKVTATHRPI